MLKADLLIHSAGQLLTLAGGRQAGKSLGELGLIEDGAIAIEGEHIVAAGPTKALAQEVEAGEVVDAAGRVVMPGFVDPHTHLIWAGDRAHEFEQRLAGVPYLDILKQGGGILYTVEQTRRASLERLIDGGRQRLQRMLALGTTTVEAKTGYGLELESELRMLQAILMLDDEGPWDLVPTLLAGHAIPPEYKADPDGYVELVCNRMLPEVERWWLEHSGGRALPFVDVFCEEGAFGLAQSERMLRAAAGLGFPRKVHADEFEALGGSSLAAELGAVSVDHLVATTEADMRALGKSGTVAVSLPATPFGLGQTNYTPAGRLLQAGATLALATDLNPGTAPGESMQFVLALACRYLKLTPAEAIAAATINAAAAVGLEHDRGSLEPGKLADALILDVDDYRQLGYCFGGNLVRQVYKRGRLVVERA
ncbi:MAG TPA: imidazolonepropionase [Anaerolineales bacterium]